MANNYNIMADYIVSKYIERVSGRDLSDTFVEDNPADRVMVGMLAENRIDTTFQGGYAENSSTKFESVPSISLSFVVKKNQGLVRIIPRGLFFYMIQPDYEMTIDYILQKYREKDKHPYANIVELSNTYADKKISVPLTYKKIDIAEKFGDGIELSLSGLSTSNIHLEAQIENKLNEIASSLSPEIRIVNKTRIPFLDLVSKEKFEQALTIKNEPVYPRWKVDIFTHIVEEGDSLRFLLQMVNKTPVNDGKNVGYLPKIFDAGITVTGNDVEFQEIKLDYFSIGYKKRDPIYAVTENTSARYVKDNAGRVCEIQTDNIPKYYQKRLITKDDLKGYVTFEKLINDPITNLNFILNRMKEDYERCESEFEQLSDLSAMAKEKYQKALIAYRGEIDRFETGIHLIEYKDTVKTAFAYMNKTFQTKLNPASRKNITGWRLFQIVFIVSMLAEAVRSEYREDASLSAADLEVANLLYFPTGGGKTEAFLGITVFTMFFDRLRGKNQGITAFLKYPLRLLAVQQLGRVLTIIMKANKVRKESAALREMTEFRVGFYVGNNNTPNKIDIKERLSSRGGQQQDLEDRKSVV